MTAALKRPRPPASRFEEQTCTLSHKAKSPCGASSDWGLKRGLKKEAAEDFWRVYKAVENEIGSNESVVHATPSLNHTKSDSLLQTGVLKSMLPLPPYNIGCAKGKGHRLLMYMEHFQKIPCPSKTFLPPICLQCACKGRKRFFPFF